MQTRETAADKTAQRRRPKPIAESASYCLQEVKVGQHYYREKGGPRPERPPVETGGRERHRSMDTAGQPGAVGHKPVYFEGEAPRVGSHLRVRSGRPGYLAGRLTREVSVRDETKDQTTIELRREERSPPFFCPQRLADQMTHSRSDFRRIVNHQQRKAGTSSQCNESGVQVAERQAIHRRRIQAIAKASETSAQIMHSPVIPLCNLQSERDPKLASTSFQANRLRLEMSGGNHPKKTVPKERNFLNGLVQNLSRLDAGRPDLQMTRFTQKPVNNISSGQVGTRGDRKIVTNNQAVESLVASKALQRTKVDKKDHRKLGEGMIESFREEPRRSHSQVLECIVSSSWHIQ
jgi:hypothetical protein